MNANKPDKLPANAVFPVPPVCTASWKDSDWVNWWIGSGGKTK